MTTYPETSLTSPHGTKHACGRVGGNEMARYQQQRYPIGSVSSGTMRPEDLILTFLFELSYQRKHGPRVSRATRKAHTAILNVRRTDPDYWDSEQPGWDLEELFDALGEYAGPYFYFGAHPGDGADYGYWLSEGFDQDFDGLKVSDTSEIPPDYRGEVLVVNDHGNCTLYVKTARTLREVWAVV